MYKTLTAIAVAVVITIAAVAAPHQAEARGGRIAAGIIGGLAAGAIIGSIVANRGYYYAPGYYYGLGPYYYGPGRYYGYGPGGEVAYCMQRFRSYDPRSGTYLGYDGYRHPCP